MQTSPHTFIPIDIRQFSFFQFGSRRQVFLRRIRFLNSYSYPIFTYVGLVSDFYPLTTLLASVIAFVTTNIDDIFVLIFLFSNPRLKRRNVVIGQFLGISSLIGISFIASFIGLIIDLKYVGLLGLVPIYIGLKSLSVLWKKIGPETNIDANFGSTGNAVQQSLSVASITIANGGDNISIYIPLYATLTNVGKINMTIMFLIMTALWCLIARYLSNHPALKRSFEKYGHIVTPFIFILLGIYIMYESNTFDLL